MADLVAKFENSLGRKHRLRIKDVNTKVEPAAVRASLEKLTTVDLFHNNKEARLFDKVLTASYFETIDTYIFDKATDEESCAEPEVVEETGELRALAQSQIPTELPSMSMADWNITLIEEQMVEPTLLRQVLELPANVTLKNLSQEQKRSLVTTKIPEGGQPLTARVYEEREHIRIELFVELKEEIREKDKSSPQKDKRRRGKQLDRLKKRR